MTSETKKFPDVRTVCRVLTAMILAVAFLRVLFAPPALAAGAAQVYTNNGKLDLLTPYWTNGNAATSLWELVGGYNAYFNAVTSTLT